MKKIIHDSIPSTQTEAALRLMTTPRPFVVLAYNQTDGYGKFGRAWVSYEANFTATFAVDLILQYYDLGKIPMLVCIKLCELLSALTGLEKAFRIKWPNDILLNRKKIGGVLIEKLDHSLLFGIGLNLKYSPKEINASYGATNVFCETNVGIAPERILEELSKYFSHFDKTFNECAAADVRKNYMTLLEGVGHEIKVVTHYETLVGRLQDINDDGALVLDVNGEHKLIYSADIFYRSF